MKHYLAMMVGLLVLLLVQASVHAQPPKAPQADLRKLYEEVRRLTRQQYPKATTHMLNNRIHFEQDSRIFVVHEPLLTGEWQDPVEERGPQKGGIYCDMELRPGEYKGQAAVPSAADKRYFTVYTLAPYSKKNDCHLYVQLKCPRDMPKGFLEAFDKLANEFETYLGP